MPRYVVQRSFPDGLQIPVGNSEFCQTVVDRNAEQGVTWVHSYVSANKRTTFCIYDAPTPEAIRRTATATSCRSTRSPGCACSTPTPTQVRGCDADRAGLRRRVGRRDSARGADSSRLWSGQRAPGDDWRSQ
jgi:hypothetical protein